MEMINGFPRRCDILLNTEVELKIREAILAVESLGANTLLTDAVILLCQAKDKVSDFIELDKEVRMLDAI